MIRALTFAGGIAGAVSLSQFPEFSQQYLQRLSGAVDELGVIVARFDADADRANLTRDEALAEYAKAGGFLAEQGAARSQEIQRFEAHSADYAALKEAAPLQRLTQVHRFSDPDLAARTWDDFRPAVPVTVDGFICAAIGYGAAWLALTLLFAAVTRAVRRPGRGIAA